MASLVFKNMGITALEVADLGIYLAVGEDLDLILNYNDEDLIESTDLEAAILGDGEVKLNGTTILTYSELIDYLTKLTRYDVIDIAYIASEDATTDITAAELEELTDGSDSGLHIHDSRYYTETELSTSNTGTVEVHWDNIINAPQFGSLEWKEPVICNIIEKGDTTAMNAFSALEGHFWWNSGDDHIYRYTTGSWVDQGAPSIDDRIIYKDGSASNDYIYQHDGSSWGLGTAPIDNWTVMVNDDGDGSPGQYVYDSTNAPPNWIKIADVDWGTASYIDVTPTGNISSTNVQAALEELQGDINIINGIFPGIDLDYAYNNGSVIAVDTTNVDWRVTDTKLFNVSDSAGAAILSVAALSSGDKVTINGAMDFNGSFDIDSTAASTISVTGSSLTLETLTLGSLDISSAGNLSFNDQYLTSSINLSESGTTALDASFTATSIIGAINEANSSGVDSLDEAYDGETGTRIVTMDNGTIEFQMTDTYEFNVADSAGSDILSVRALAAGDLVRITGDLDVNAGAITLDAIEASNFTVVGANLTLKTSTSGNVIINSAGIVDIDGSSLDADFTGAFNLDGGASSDIKVTSGNLNLTTVTSGDIGVTSSGDLSLDDQYLTSSINLSESGTTALDASFTATSIIGAINELMTSGGAVDTLDDAYDGPSGSGSGKIIIADSGSVKIDATSATYAPLELTSQLTAPTSGLAAGQMSMIDGELYYYDSTRSKWLSVAENNYSWSDNVVDGRYLSIGQGHSHNLGHIIPQNGTIVKTAIIVGAGNLTKEFEIRKNGVIIALKAFSTVAGKYTSINDNIDVVAGDVIQIYASSYNSPAKRVVASLHLKWRK